MRASVLIVSPYAASANNGNWRTAERWARLLEPAYRVIVRTAAEPLQDADVLIALHARRSHLAVQAWCRSPARRPCVLVLTGTDLYRDIPDKDPQALESLRLAQRLVVLQERGVRALPARYRSKAAVVYQSAPRLEPFRKSARSLRALFAGHIRPEKDPLTFLDAAALLAPRSDIACTLVGAARDPELARTLAERHPRLAKTVLLGARSHGETRQHIRRAHVLVVPSRMEGGANVIVEAATAGTAVIASDCDGNIGMLGEDYPGYFPRGDACALARLLERCRDEPGYLERLTCLCVARARRFSPEAERRALRQLLASL